MAGLRVSAGAHGSGEKRYHYLDAAQLVKHAFGLGHSSASGSGSPDRELGSDHRPSLQAAEGDLVPESYTGIGRAAPPRAKRTTQSAERDSRAYVGRKGVPRDSNRQIERAGKSAGYGNHNRTPNSPVFVKSVHYQWVMAWRRGWDSNPRGPFGAYSLSRGAPSTARPPLRGREYSFIHGVVNGTSAVSKNQLAQNEARTRVGMQQDSGKARLRNDNSPHQSAQLLSRTTTACVRLRLTRAKETP